MSGSRHGRVDEAGSIPAGAPLLDTEVPRQEVVPSHTHDIFDPSQFAHVVNWTVDTVKAGGYEAIAGSGHSGLPLIGAVAYRLGIPMIAVRKSDERPKGDTSRVNGVLPHRSLRYAIVDDIICSGETILRVEANVAHVFPQAKLAGVILHCARSDDPYFIAAAREQIVRVLGQERGDALAIHIRTYRRAP